MCNAWCVDFVRRCSRFWPAGAHVLEVGSLNVNGSPRDAMPESIGPYIGVDLHKGPGVDMVLDACKVNEFFGCEQFDVVISTEMLEHVRDWRPVIYNMLAAAKPNGFVCITTRSPGFEYHPYPLDCWRFTTEDMQRIFVADYGLPITHMETDPDLRKGKYSGVGVLVQRKCSLDVLAADWRNEIEGINVHTP